MAGLLVEPVDEGNICLPFACNVGMGELISNLKGE